MTALLLVVHGLFAASLIVASVLAVRARSGVQLRGPSTVLFGLVLAQTAAGFVLYPRYIRGAKPALKALAAGQRTVADLFEVKEHLAFLALALTLAAFVATRGEKPTSPPVTRVLVGASHAAIVLVAVLGVAIASVKLP